MRSSLLHKFTLVLVFCAFVQVVEGALTTSKTAAFIATGHRHLGLALAAMVVAIGIWIARTDSRRTIRTLAAAAMALAGAEGAFFSLPILHACLAQVLFCVLVAWAVKTSPSYLGKPDIVEDSGSPSLRTLSISTSVVMMGQITLGAAFRHHAIGGMAHMIGAVFVLGLALLVGIFTLTQHAKHRNLRQSSLALLFGTFAQVFLGLGAYVAREAVTTPQIPLETALLTASHVAVGTLTMAASIVLVLQVARYVKRITIVRVTTPGAAATS